MNSSIYTLSSTLLTYANYGNWDEIVEIYENNPDAHTTKITKSGDSALHLAVQDDNDEVVMKLVGLIVRSHHPDKLVEVLGLKNERGDTPLHSAASMGNLPMCHELAHSKPELIGLRNDEGETPLFVAAANGKKNAFLYLYSLIPEDGREETGMSYGRRANSGDTVLHCALEGDYFDLAFQIITRFPGLGNRVNEQGCSPLHLLASNPSAFRSGSRFGIIDGIIYNCIFVNRLTVDPKETSNFMTPWTMKGRTRSTTYPKNYLVCVNFFFFLKNVCVHFYDFFLGRRRIPAAERATDTESQVAVRQTSQVLPPDQVDYYDIFDFLKLVCKAMFIILVVGHRKIEKMLEKKKKHALSRQIIKILLKESSGLYDHNGQVPGNLHLRNLLDGGTAPYDLDHEELLFDFDLEIGGEAESSSSKRETPILLPVIRETPILVAAKNGITEMVESILKKFPLAINDMNDDKKNIVLLAVEHGQVDLYKRLLFLFKENDRVFQKVDREGNSALHIAASGRHIQGLVPGAALQLHERYIWYEFVKRSKPRDFFPKYNKERMKALEVLNKRKKDLIGDANKWMSDTAQSCSVVAVLVATIAYTTSAAIPGGFKGEGSGGRDSGLPVLGGHAMFDVFSFSGDVAFVLSVMALVLFLPVFSSYNKVSHFRTAAPAKLLVGLTLLLLSLTAVMVSFSAAESFIVVNGNLKFMKFLIFAATCFPIILVANQFPIYFRIFKSIVQYAFA